MSATQWWTLPSHMCFWMLKTWTCASKTGSRKPRRSLPISPDQFQSTPESGSRKHRRSLPITSDQFRSVPKHSKKWVVKFRKPPLITSDHWKKWGRIVEKEGRMRAPSNEEQVGPQVGSCLDAYMPQLSRTLQPYVILRDPPCAPLRDPLLAYVLSIHWVFQFIILLCCLRVDIRTSNSIRSEILLCICKRMSCKML